MKKRQPFIPRNRWEERKLQVQQVPVTGATRPVIAFDATRPIAFRTVNPISVQHTVWANKAGKCLGCGEVLVLNGTKYSCPSLAQLTVKK